VHLTVSGNGKMERWYGTVKGECIRVQTPLSVEDARRLVANFVTHYNTVRLHSAIAYVTPADKLAGRAEAIWTTRRQKLATANARRRAKTKDKGAAQPEPCKVQCETWAEDRATRGRDPSADPGAKTGEGSTMLPHGLPGLAQMR